MARYTYHILMEICARGESEELLNRLDTARAEFNEQCRRVEDGDRSQRAWREPIAR